MSRISKRKRSAASADASESTHQAKPKTAESGVEVLKTRVLPLYVFSLLSAHELLTIGHDALVYASAEAVMVLQTNSSAIPLPYLSDGHSIQADATDATRHALAGWMVWHLGYDSPAEALRRVRPVSTEVGRDGALLVATRLIRLGSECQGGLRAICSKNYVSKWDWIGRDRTGRSGAEYIRLMGSGRLRCPLLRRCGLRLKAVE